MGRSKFQDYLPDECYRKYSCRHCRANLASHDELISKVRHWVFSVYETSYPIYVSPQCSSV